MKVFVFLGLRPIENWLFNDSLSFFFTQAYWKLIYQWECLFFWSQALWKTVLCLFWYKFKVFWGPALFFQWESLFFGPRPIENCFLMTKTVLCHFLNEFFDCFLGPELFFNESLCLFGFSTIERRFSMRVFFLSQSELKVDFSMTVFVFWSQAYWKLIF